MSTVADRLYRRVQMMVAAVKITGTDDSGPVHRVQIRGFPPEQIDAMPVLQIYGLASHAMIGSDAMAMFVSGDRSNGVIIATGNQKYRLRGLKSGEVALYDDTGSVIRLARGSTIEVISKTELKVTTPKVTIEASDTVAITAAGKVTVTAPEIDLEGLVKITGDLEIVGNLKISGSITGAGVGGTHWDVG